MTSDSTMASTISQQPLDSSLIIERRSIIGSWTSFLSHLRVQSLSHSTGTCASRARLQFALLSTLLTDAYHTDLSATYNSQKKENSIFCSPLPRNELAISLWLPRKQLSFLFPTLSLFFFITIEWYIYEYSLPV